VKAERTEQRGQAYTLACGGNLSTAQASNWVFRNFNERAPITITRMRFFDAQGGLIFDSLTNGMPAASNGVLGPDDSVLKPHQTAQFTSDALIADGTLVPLPATQRPIMLLVNAVARGGAQPLAGTLTRITRSVDTGAEIARTASACTVVMAR
jgi:hypothetical protein